MHVDVMNMELVHFLEECATLAQKKNRDYHPDKVAYLEILHSSWETSMTVEQDLWGRLHKQMSALRRFVIEGKVESEPPLQRMMDVANYMALMAVWIEHRKEIVTDALDFVLYQKRCTRNGEFGRGCLDNLFEACDRCLFAAYLTGYEGKIMGDVNFRQ